MAHPTTAPTTISSLPAELLGLIFEFCAELKNLEKVNHRKVQLNEPPWHFISNGLSLSQRFSPQVDRFKLLKSGVWFPYSHASVCRYWMEVLSSSPRFWRTAIFHLDPKSRPPFDAASVLSWSNDLPIDIVVFKEERPRTTDDISEKRHVRTLVDMFSTHIHRCRSLHFDVHSSSSLPLILQHFMEYPSILESLSLFCDSDDHAEDRVLSPVQPKWAETCVSSLRSLVLDGRNLADVYMGWLRSQVALEQLVLLNYSLGGEHAIHLEHILQTLQRLPHLFRLKFHNVSFDLSAAINEFFTAQIRVLHFEEVEPSLIDKIFRLCILNELHTIHITRCSLSLLPTVPKLVLEDIDPRIPLETYLREWEGFHLWIGRCRGFGDSLLDMLRKTIGWNNEGWDDSDFQCPWLETLYLAYLPRFSLKRLKKMIKVRNRFINYDDPNWKTTTPFGPAIRELHIVHCDIADLTEEDMEWFRSRLVTFRYIKRAESEL